MEVHVHDGRQRPASERPSEIPERVRRGERGEDPPRREPNPGRCRERGPRLARGEVRRRVARRRAVDVAELRARLRDVRRRCTSRRRRRASARGRGRGGAFPRLGTRGPGRRRRSVARGRERSSACGGRTGRAPTPRGPARARRRRPHRAAASAGRTSAAIRKPPGRRSLQRRESRPHLVVERSFDVAGDDRVPFPAVPAHRGRSLVGIAAWCAAPSPSSSSSAAALPRLAVLAPRARRRSSTEFVEKSDDFARRSSSTARSASCPGIPSAYTQPLYGWFLAAIYWPFGRIVARRRPRADRRRRASPPSSSWRSGRRFCSTRVGVVAALLATLHPYLVWHDVHVNREILDELLLALRASLLALLAFEERLVLAGGGDRCRPRARDPRQLAPRPPAARRSAPYVAWQVRPGRRALAVGAVARPRRRDRRRAVGRAQPRRRSAATR